MRVIQVINHAGLNRGGAERLARGLHEALRARGIDARLIALEACETEGLDGAESLGFASPYDPRATVALGRRLRALAGPGDVVHVHLFPASAHVAALRAAGRIAAPCLFTEHNTSNRRRARRWGRAADRAVYARYATVAAISRGTEAALLAAYPELQGRTCVVENGAVLRFSAPLHRMAREAVTILSVGRLVAQKNYPAALLAVTLLGDRPWRYVICGDGPERPRLEALIGELGIADRVELRGHVTEIGPELEAADIFLMPSAWEGFGLAAVEAMNAALPLVVSDVPGLREVTGTDGACATLVPPDDTDAIARALAALAESPETRQKMGEAGFARASDFGMEKMTDSYLACYRTLLEGRGHGAA